MACGLQTALGAELCSQVARFLIFPCLGVLFAIRYSSSSSSCHCLPSQPLHFGTSRTRLTCTTVSTLAALAAWPSAVIAYLISIRVPFPGYDLVSFSFCIPGATLPAGRDCPNARTTISSYDGESLSLNGVNDQTPAPSVLMTASLVTITA